MSRSYKKFPAVTDNKHSHEMKKVASRITRRKLKGSDEILKGSIYKKHFQSYDICDYKFVMSKNEAMQFYNENIKSRYGDRFKGRYPTLKDFLVGWKKTYYCK